MQYKNYLARKRARFEGICGHVNIPYGNRPDCSGRFYYVERSTGLWDTSQNAYDYFTQTMMAGERNGANWFLPFLLLLERRDKRYQGRWDKVWADARCQQYKRPDHDDHWIWNFEFYNAPVEDLKHIFNLIRKG